jgi:hypothetical protein
MSIEVPKNMEAHHVVKYAPEILLVRENIGLVR